MSSPIFTKSRFERIGIFFCSFLSLNNYFHSKPLTLTEFVIVQKTSPIYCILLFFLVMPVVARTEIAKPDTVLRKYFFYENEFQSRHKHSIDTSFYRFHVYNPILKDDLPFFQYLGNVGTAANGCLFHEENDVGFIYHKDAFENYLFRADRVKYYQLRKPFTDISYVMGTRKEQLLQVLHSQNITKTWNATLDFHLIDSPGSYLKQETYHTVLSFCTNYITKNKKYGVLANYIFNKVIVSESGGISADSLFSQNIEINLISGITIR